MRNATLLLLVLGVVTAYRLQGAEAQISFSLPGKWGHKRATRYKFSLPGSWGSATKRAVPRLSLPVHWGHDPRAAAHDLWAPDAALGLARVRREALGGCDDITVNVLVLKLEQLIKDWTSLVDCCLLGFEMPPRMRDANEA